MLTRARGQLSVLFDESWGGQSVGLKEAWACLIWQDVKRVLQAGLLLVWGGGGGNYMLTSFETHGASCPGTSGSTGNVI